MIYYIYDASGNVIGLKYNDDIYYYEKNIQNDITGIMDDSFNMLATYEYDSWGNILSIKDTNGNTITDSSNIALINPFRYRSYYYDSEIGMYYLNSRYYNSERGRFINVDETTGQIGGPILGHNMYQYAFNNPINLQDEDGNWPKWLKAVAIVTAAIVVVAAVTLATAGTGTAAAVIAAGVLKGAVTGAGTGAVLGGVSSAIQVGQAASAWGEAGERNAYENMASHYSKHVLNEGHTYLGKNIIQYTNNPKSFYGMNQGIMRLTSSGNYAIRATFSGHNVGGFFSQAGKIFSFF